IRVPLARPRPWPPAAYAERPTTRGSARSFAPASEQACRTGRCVPEASPGGGGIGRTGGSGAPAFHARQLLPVRYGFRCSCQSLHDELDCFFLDACAEAVPFQIVRLDSLARKSSCLLRAVEDILAFQSAAVVLID